MDYENDKFIHALIYTYNEVMRLLELASVVEHKLSCDHNFMLMFQHVGIWLQMFLSYNGLTQM